LKQRLEKLTFQTMNIVCEFEKYIAPKAKERYYYVRGREKQ
jgi:cell division protein FtsB